MISKQFLAAVFAIAGDFWEKFTWNVPFSMSVMSHSVYSESRSPLSLITTFPYKPARGWGRRRTNKERDQTPSSQILTLSQRTIEQNYFNFCQTCPMPSFRPWGNNTLQSRHVLYLQEPRGCPPPPLWFSFFFFHSSFIFEYHGNGYARVSMVNSHSKESNQ